MPHRRSARILVPGLALWLVGGTLPAASVDPAALRIVEIANQEILRISGTGRTPDPERLAHALDRFTHYEKLAQAILRPYSDYWTLKEESEVSRVLGDYLEAIGLWAFHPYDVDRFEVGETRTVFRSARITVLAHHQGTSLPITYELDRFDGEWFIVDYTVGDENIVYAYQKRFEDLFGQGKLAPIIAELEHLTREARGARRP